MAKIEIINGVEGMCVTINDTRIAGNKPWGGGKIVNSWIVDNDWILYAMEASNQPLKSENHSTDPKCGRCGGSHFTFECPDEAEAM